VCAVWEGFGGDLVTVAATGAASLERDESIAILEGLLERVRLAEEGRLVLLGGEAGVGKTSLLRCFCAGAASSARVLWGACEPLLTPRSLGALLEVAEGCGGDLEQVVAKGGRTHEIVSGLIDELSGRRPAIIVLEDVHWADGATLDVLRLLGRRVSEAPALVVASFRDDELDRAHPLRIVFGELAGRPERLRLAPLSVQAVTTLAAPRGFDGRELYWKTGATRSS
jgi:predicted ATPase